MASDSDSSSHRSARVLAFPLGGRVAATADPKLRQVIGEVLREERHHQDRTLTEVAEEAAVSVPYLSEVERGRKEVSSELLTSIHEALGLELHEVLERSYQRIAPEARAQGPAWLMAA